MQIVSEGLTYGIEYIQSAADRANPYLAGSVLQDRVDQIAAETLGISRILLEDSKGISVVPAHAPDRAEPEDSQSILNNAFDCCIGKPLL
jgi:hypothetical protein